MRRTQSESKPAPDAHRAAPESEIARLERENRSLETRLAGLTEEVGRNDSLLRKTQERELELLRAGSLTQLFERLINGLKTSYQLDGVALIINWCASLMPFWRNAKRCATPKRCCSSMIARPSLGSVTAS